jgi:transposase
MRKAKGTLQREDSTKGLVLKMALELSMSKWKVAFGWEEKSRYVAIGARDLDRLQEEIGKARKRFGLEEGVGVLSCYEAGRDGFWLHRYLVSKGIENRVVDSSSIEVNRRKRRAKTDRLDAGKLVEMLRRYEGGEKRVWSVVRVPSVEEEDGRQLSREWEALNGERKRQRSRILSLLIQQGIYEANPSRKSFLRELEEMQTWEGKKLSGDIKERLVREYERLQEVEERRKELAGEREEKVEEGVVEGAEKVKQLRKLYGVGKISSWMLVMELFRWRRFKSRQEVGAIAGLAPTPYDSGGGQREQGISKAGNWRVRATSVELAWAWLRFQGRSIMSRWFGERFGMGGGRMRRIGIVALARWLLVALWRYLEFGVVPEGARLRKGSAA